jgi:hypothetical protein
MDIIELWHQHDLAMRVVLLYQFLADPRNGQGSSFTE